MKKKYWVTRNGIVMGIYEDMDPAKARAEELEKKPLNWREMDDGVFALGEGTASNRNEYEIRKKRA